MESIGGAELIVREVEDEAVEALGLMRGVLAPPVVAEVGRL